MTKTAFAIGAHPDDIEFGAGGTLAKWALAGSAITMLVVTDGSKGTWDPAMDPDNLIEQRAAEQRAAARVLGATEVIHLDQIDGELEYSMELREIMCAQIRRARPDVVVSHDPWRRYQLHPDHRVTGWAVMDGVIAARDHLFFPEQQLAAHRPPAVKLSGRCVVSSLVCDVDLFSARHAHSTTLQSHYHPPESPTCRTPRRSRSTASSQTGTSRGPARCSAAPHTTTAAVPG